MQPRPCSDAVHLTLEPPLRNARLDHFKNFEFDARRSRIDDQDGVHRPITAVRSSRGAVGVGPAGRRVDHGSRA